MKINQRFYIFITIVTLVTACSNTLFAQQPLLPLYAISYIYQISTPVFEPIGLHFFLSNYDNNNNQNNNAVKAIYNTSYFFYTISPLSNYNGNSILVSVLEEENKEKEESILRRAEILFFISIPFIYIYINLLINLQNSMLGNAGVKYTEGQTFFMITTILLFGLEVIITDSKKDS